VESTKRIAVKFWFAENLNEAVAFVPGDRVLVGGDIPAMVVAVQVQLENQIIYKAQWWDDRTYKCEWFQGVELHPA
jgi:uncharacterized protein YodC (DUF2158 family)